VDAVTWASGGQYFKDCSVLRLLLEHGSDINVQNQTGLTPLQWASYKGALEVVHLLLEHGADAEVRNVNEMIRCDSRIDKPGTDACV
jgi:ankyrin repeat protein